MGSVPPSSTGFMFLSSLAAPSRSAALFPAITWGVDGFVVTGPIVLNRAKQSMQRPSLSTPLNYILCSKMGLGGGACELGL